MPLITYVPKTFRPDTMKIIHKANEIISIYVAQGYKLTLRQLYYQFVSRDLLPNTVRSYGKLGLIVNHARLAGLIDWEAIEDRTRNLKSLAHFQDPPDIIKAAAQQHRLDKWSNQPYRVEIWIEKEALAGVFERVCQELDVPFFCCRGYTSQSEMWVAAQRLRGYRSQKVIILHFGDHDPSGIDMTRDIQDRLNLFGLRFDMRRLALNMDQIEEYDPPPNPAKDTDTRFKGYILKYSHSSWELDALEPQILADLVRTEIQNKILDKKKWKKIVEEETEHQKFLTLAADNWEDVSSYIENNFKK